MLFLKQTKRITTNKSISISLVVLLVSTSFIGLIIFESDNASAYTVHGTIRIDGDTDFATQAGIEGWAGDGSEGNPYIIEDYEIDGTGNGSCIYIGNTTKHFIIRNCSLHNASGNPGIYYYNSAVMLYNVLNGVVENTTCTDSAYGIYVRISTGINITNVTSTNNNDGMYVYDSYYVNTSGSDFTSNSNYGLYIRYGYYFKIDNSTFTDSGNDGMQLRYLYYTIIENVSVSNNGDDGLYLYEGYDVIIYYSDFLNNTGDGIYLQEAYTIYVEHNEINDNDIGIKLYHTSTDYVSYNNITNSTSYGIYDDGYGDNVIHHNNFIDNNAGGVQAYDSASGKNTWNDTNGEGNYWNDYVIVDNDLDGIADIPYLLDGDNFGWDYHPLMVVDGQYTPTGIDAPIRINSDLYFDAIAVAKGWAGNGTEENPYIIEDYDINGSDFGSCIYIGNSTKNFIIRNCSLHNASGNPSLYYKNSGIYLYNTTNGTLRNNSVFENEMWGVSLLESDYNIIRNNTCYENEIGVWMRLSNDNDVNNNTLNFNNGSGLKTELCGPNTISFNDILNNSQTGLVLAGTYFCNVYQNQINGNLGDGVYIGDNGENTLNNNVISQNDGNGIYLFGWWNSIIIYNNLINNADYGIVAETSGPHTIHHNNFIANNDGGVQANDTDGLSYWNDTIGEGNYWSDYENRYVPPATNNGNIWDTAYDINGTGSPVDAYPLAYQAVFSLTKHDPIRIDDDLGFTFENGTIGGNGTKDYPYVIAGWDINGTGYGYCTYIGNTSKYYIIRDCYLFGASGNGGPYYWNSNVGLYRTNNGTVSQNNISYGGTRNIYLFRADNLTISNNNISDSQWSLDISSFCADIYVNRNNFSDQSSGSGIYIAGSTSINHRVTNNTFQGGGSGIHSGSSASGNKIINNTCLGQYDGIKLSISNNNVVMDNYVSLSLRGIDLTQSSGNYIENNTVIDKAYWGMRLRTGSNNNTIKRNSLISNNDGGIYIEGSNGNEVSYNTIKDNTDHAVEIINSFGNEIHHNIFSDNNGSGVQASDNTGTNFWNDTGYRGNFWGDYTTRYPTAKNDGYIWDIPYEINGGAGALDYYPLAHNSHGPIIITSDSEFASMAATEGWQGDGSASNPYIIEGYEINASSFHGIYISDTTVHFIIRDCFIHDGQILWNYGIELIDLGNGTIENCSFYNNEDHIDLDGVSNITIKNCNMDTSGYVGIYLNPGCNNISIVDNDIENGVGGIYATGMEDFEYIGNHINSCDTAIYLSWCERGELNENVLTHTSGTYGYRINNMMNVNVTNSTINGIGRGIEISSSSRVNFDRMRVVNNNNPSWPAFIITSTDNCSVTNSSFINNQAWAIDLSSSSENNTLHHNNFIDNNGGGIQARDNGINNRWNDSFGEGNYWNDFKSRYPLATNDGHIWDRSYDLDGTGSASDNYPISHILYTPSPTIRINSDDEFDLMALSKGWLGNGTPGNPYIIEGYEINGTGYGNCIFIGNTSKYFIIQNCSIYGASGNGDYYYDNTGIHLYRADDGIIRNNTIESCEEWGICLHYTSDNTIENNSINNCGSSGIYIRNNYDNAVVRNNTLANHGDEGIYISWSDGNYFYDNKMVNCGFDISGSREYYTDQVIAESNTVNGAPVYHYKSMDMGWATVPPGAGQIILGDVTNLTIQGQNIHNTTDCIIIAYCTNISVLDNRLVDSYNGIEMHDSFYCIIDNNTILNTSGEGMDLDESGFLDIVRNTVISCGNGILLEDTTNSTISQNYIEDSNYGLFFYDNDFEPLINILVERNTLYQNWDGIHAWGLDHSTFMFNDLIDNGDEGIDLDALCDNNTLHHNNFISNGDIPQVDDDGMDNRWNDSFGQGNYWDDYESLYVPPAVNNSVVWNISYTINAALGAFDYFPLVNMAVYVPPPPSNLIRINNDLEFTSENGVVNPNATGTVSDPYIIENLTINGQGYGFCIYIGNTTKHFIIRNCTLKNASGNPGPYYRNSGILLNNIANGSIENCTFDNNDQFDILVVSSINTTIIDNDMTGTLKISGLAEDINVINNTFTDQSGIFLDCNPGMNDVHTITGNTYEGLPILYYKSINGVDIPVPASIGQLLVAECTDIQLSQFTTTCPVYGGQILDSAGVDISQLDLLATSGDLRIKNSSNIWIINSTLLGAPGESLCVQANSIVYLLNTTYNQSGLSVSAYATIHVANYLHIYTRDLDGTTPISNVDVLVRSDFNHIYSTNKFGGSDPKTNAQGYIGFIITADKFYNGSITPENNRTFITVLCSAGLITDWEVDMSTSRTELFFFDYKGPIVSNITVNGLNPGKVQSSSLLWPFSATFDDTGLGDSTIIQAQWYLGSVPNWPSGAINPINALDSPVEKFVGTLNISGFAPGNYILWVRGQDNKSNWGPAESIVFTIVDSTGPLIIDSSINGGDPGYSTREEGVARIRATAVEMPQPTDHYVKVIQWALTESGPWTNMTPLDGEFNSTFEKAEKNLDLTGLSGTVMIYLRAIDDQGNIGPIVNNTLIIIEDSDPSVDTITCFGQTSGLSSKLSTGYLSFNATILSSALPNSTVEKLVWCIGPSPTGPWTYETGSGSPQSKVILWNIDTLGWTSDKYTLWVKAIGGNLSESDPVFFEFTLTDDLEPVMNISLKASTIYISDPELRISGSLSDITTGGSNLTGCWYAIDEVLVPGKGILIGAIDGKYDSPIEYLSSNLDISSITLGNHTIYLYTTDEKGNSAEILAIDFIVLDDLGPSISRLKILQIKVTILNTTVSISLTATDQATGASNISIIEYFIDTPGANGAGSAMGNGINWSHTVDLVSSIDISGWTAGSYVLYFHSRDEYGNWGEYETVILTILETAAITLSVNPNNVTLSQGQEVEIVITVSNVGRIVAENIDLTLILPDGIQSLEGNSWTISNLAKGTKIIRFTLKVDEDAITDRSYFVTIKLDLFDNFGTYIASSSKDLLVNVPYKNTPPRIEPTIPDITLLEDQTIYLLNLSGYGVDEQDRSEDLRWYVGSYDTSMLSISGNNREDQILTILPRKDASGSTTITVYVMDSVGSITSQEVSITITPSNDPPSMRKITDIFVHYDVDFVMDLSPYISDPDTPTSSLTMSSSDPDHVSFSGMVMTINYPESAKGETKYVTIHLSDGVSKTEQVLTIIITDDYTPEVVKDLPDITIHEGETLINVISLREYFIDPDNDKMFYSYGYTNLNISMTPEGLVTIAALGDFYGTELVTFRATDSVGAFIEDFVRVTVVPVNDPPAIKSLPDLNVHYDFQYQFDLAPYIEDVDTPLSDLVITTSYSEYITVDPSDNLLLLIEFPISFVGQPILIGVKVSDGTLTNNQVLSVTVSDNWAPEVILEVNDVVTNEDTPLKSVFSVFDVFYDKDGTVLNYQWFGANLTIELHEDGFITITPDENMHGHTTVLFRAEDPRGGIAEIYFLVTVISIDDPPTISPLPDHKGKSGEMWILDLSTFLSDVDTDISNLNITTDSEFVTASGSVLVFNYPAGKYEESVTVTISDGTSTTNESFHVSVSAAQKDQAENFLSTLLVVVLILIIILSLFGFTAYRKYKGDYKIEEVFCIYNNGLLISHVTSKDSRHKADEDVVSGMLTAIINFTQDAFSKEEEDEKAWGIKEIQMNEKNILVERGKYTILATVISGRSGTRLYSKSRKTISTLENKYNNELQSWKGNYKKVDGTSEILKTLLLKQK